MSIKESDLETSAPKKRSHRSFISYPKLALTALTMLVASTALLPRDASAQLDPPPNSGSDDSAGSSELKYPISVNWVKMHQIASDLAKSEKRIWAKPTAEEISKELKDFERTSKPYLQRLNKLTELVDAQEARRYRQKSGTSLIEEYRKFIGPTAIITPEKAIPQFVESHDMSQAFDSLFEDFLELQSIKVQDPEANVTEKLEYILNNVKGGKAYTNRANPQETREKCKNQQFISMDPAIQSTPEGRAEFQKDKARIAPEVVKLPLFKELCLDFMLTSPRYGDIGRREPITADADGIFKNKRQPSNRIIYADAGVKTDFFEELGLYSSQMIATHEILGHGSDVLNLLSLGSILNEESLVNRQTEQMKALNDRDWGAYDDSVTRLFQFSPPKDLEALLSGKDKVSRREFMGVIVRYPKLSLMPNWGFSFQENGFTPALLSVTDMATGNIDLDSVYANKEQALKEGIQTFASLPHFARDNMQYLKKQAQQGDIRAKLIDLGLSNFLSEFSKTEVFPDMTYQGIHIIPVNDLSAETYHNYARFIITDAVLLHLLFTGPINGVDIRDILDEKQIQNAFKIFLEKRINLRKEFHAEAAAYAYILGPRLEDNPHSRLLKDLSSRLN